MQTIGANSAFQLFFSYLAFVVCAVLYANSDSESNPAIQCHFCCLRASVCFLWPLHRSKIELFHTLHAVYYAHTLSCVIIFFSGNAKMVHKTIIIYVDIFRSVVNKKNYNLKLWRWCLRPSKLRQLPTNIVWTVLFQFSNHFDCIKQFDCGKRRNSSIWMQRRLEWNEEKRCLFSSS